MPARRGECGARRVRDAVRFASASAGLTVGACDPPLLGFRCDAPRQRNVNRGDSMVADPLAVDSPGTIVLSDRPGMSYEFDFIALANTRIMTLVRRGEVGWIASGCR